MLEQQANPNVEIDEISLKELIQKIQEWFKFLKTQMKLIIGIAAIGAVIGFVYASFQKPIYKAALTFALEDEKSGGGLGGALKIPVNDKLNFIPINYIKSIVNNRNRTLFNYDSVYLVKLRQSCQTNAKNMVVIADHINDLPTDCQIFFKDKISLPIFIGRKKGYKINIYVN
jgi:hypothetical protein